MGLNPKPTITGWSAVSPELTQEQYRCCSLLLATNCARLRNQAKIHATVLSALREKLRTHTGMQRSAGRTSAKTTSGECTCVFCVCVFFPYKKKKTLRQTSVCKHRGIDLIYWGTRSTFSKECTKICDKLIFKKMLWHIIKYIWGLPCLHLKSTIADTAVSLLAQ